jgi:predicted ester cyclase
MSDSEVTRMNGENKALCRRVVDCINSRQLDEGAALHAPFYVFQGPGMEFRGPEGWRQLVMTYLNAFPDLVLWIDDIIGEGDKVAVRFTAKGTHRGELAGISGTGRPVTVPCISVMRFANGKIIEEYEAFDNLGLFQSIGRMPALTAEV